MYVERKQIHVERMRFATRQMLIQYASANPALRGTNRLANVKVVCDQFYYLFPLQQLTVQRLPVQSIQHFVLDCWANNLFFLDQPG